MSTPATVENRKGGWIQTYTLRQFWPLDPRPEDVCVEDIAHALSNQCRFTGQTEFYSVAQHCVLVSMLAEDLAYETYGNSTQEAARRYYVRHVAQWGLLHDAEEAYLLDLPRPVKHLPELAPYREAAAHLRDIIIKRFRVGLEEPDEVKRADKVLCATEARDLFRGFHPAWVQPGEPLAETIEPWTPRRAKERFLQRFAALFHAERVVLP